MYFTGHSQTTIAWTKTDCEHLDLYAGEISYNSPGRRIQYYKKCWYIEPPEQSIVHFKVVNLDLNDPVSTS